MNKLTLAFIGSLLAGTSGLAFAQAPPPRQPVPSVEQPGQIQTNKLIGANIRNANNDTIGEIKSVALGADGNVEAVIVGVGGFLGVGNREVAIGWRDLNIGDGGNQVMMNMTKDQLAALPEYKYAAATDRGTIFRMAPRAADTRLLTAPTPRLADVPPPLPPVAAAPPATPRAADTTVASGMVSAAKLVGLNVYDTQDKSVGQIKDVVLSSRGEVQKAILTVGGVLGFGAKDVGISSRDIQFRTDGNDLKAVVAMSTDELKALPEYSNDRGAWVVKN